MESRKEKLPILFAIIVIIAICGLGFYFLENYEDVYYSRIDNTKIKKISTLEDMKYEYILESYKSNGQKKEIKFKTSRELKQDAYILLEVRITGVHSWEEVQYHELPEKVKEHYQEMQ